MIRKANPILGHHVLWHAVLVRTLWKIYNKNLDFETKNYADDLINMMSEGINP